MCPLLLCSCIFLFWLRNIYWNYFFYFVIFVVDNFVDYFITGKNRFRRGSQHLPEAHRQYVSGSVEKSPSSFGALTIALLYDLWIRYF